MCAKGRAKIEKSNQKYKENADMYRQQASFKKGDLVWIHLRKAHFFPGLYSKL